MTPSVNVFGRGYVGTLTACSLEQKGYDVIGADLSTTKLAAMESGGRPIVEPRVGDLLADGHKAGRLRATCRSEQAVLYSDIWFLCVGTPSLWNGKLDVGHIQGHVVIDLVNLERGSWPTLSGDYEGISWCGTHENLVG